MSGVPPTTFPCSSMRGTRAGRKANIMVERDPKGGPIQWLLVSFTVLFTFPQGLILEFYGITVVTLFGGSGWEPGVPPKKIK